MPGSDPTPSAGERAAEDEPASWGDAEGPNEEGPNDARLKADKPPHWA